MTVLELEEGEEVHVGPVTTSALVVTANVAEPECPSKKRLQFSEEAVASVALVLTLYYFINIMMEDLLVSGK